MSTMNWVDHLQPWAAPSNDEFIVYAVRALVDGKASDSQQKLIWEYLMYVTKASDRWQSLSYRPGEGGARDTDFAEGKRFVGIQFRKLLHPDLTPKPAATTTKR